jgi:glucosylglycerate synthase
MENKDASEQQVEESIERLCLTFERLKPYLLGSWAAGTGGS